MRLALIAIAAAGLMSPAPPPPPIHVWSIPYVAKRKHEMAAYSYHHELVPSLRRQTHGDWRHSSMRVYRRELRNLGPCPGN